MLDCSTVEHGATMSEGVSTRMGEVADRLRDLRRERGISARELAARCTQLGMPSLTRSTIAKIESGVRDFVTVAEAAVLAEALNVAPSYLLGSISKVPEESPVNAKGGFWSYVHADNDAEGGRILQLANDVVKQYELITGDSIQIFQDRTSIAWGEDWRDKVDSSLAAILFFVAVLTPRYFLSSECRRELQTFARRAEALGVEELILPVLYVDIPALAEESPVDELMALLKKYQPVDWRELRYEETGSASYRREVAKLAKRLADANQLLLSRDAASELTPESTLPEESAAEGPGDLDKLAQGESSIQEFIATQAGMTKELDGIKGIVEAATEEIDRINKQGGSFSMRLAVARRLAQNLAPRAKQILELANQYTVQLYDIDPAIRILVAQAPSSIESDPSSLSQFCTLFGSVNELANTSAANTAHIKEFVVSLAQGESLSRDLRPPIKDLRRGLSTVIEGNSIMVEWARLVSSSGVKC